MRMNLRVEIPTQRSKEHGVERSPHAVASVAGTGLVCQANVCHLHVSTSEFL